MQHFRPERSAPYRFPPVRVLTGVAAGETGSAVVEFTFLGLLLLVPVVYLVLTVGQLQGGSFAVVGAADQAAKVYADAQTVEQADLRARQAAMLAVSDFGFSGEQVLIDIACEGECLSPASSVTVVVELQVDLPLIPTMPGINTSVATLTSTSTQIVERYG
ncbi:hypothetical protein [Arthrobacter sp. H41]|uniref:hypothetical protein n=1 Tax=Arthrobacter sp. H41 TaxID=1312978 RepID=UPI0004ADEDD4|nr:hypothetical protein [Arthrobacter sp. H41]